MQTFYRFCPISPNPNSPNVNKVVTDVLNASWCNAWCNPDPNPNPNLHPNPNSDPDHNPNPDTNPNPNPNPRIRRNGIMRNGKTPFLSYPFYWSVDINNIPTVTAPNCMRVNTKLFQLNDSCASKISRTWPAK